MVALLIVMVAACARPSTQNPVPADVLPGGDVTGISRRERVKVVKMVEEADLIEPPPPRLRLVP